MEFEENNEEFEGKRTRNLKEKHREFFTRVRIKELARNFNCVNFFEIKTISHVGIINRILKTIT